jgi:hypothetical protein
MGLLMSVLPHTSALSCPLCQSPHSGFFSQDQRRCYFLCACCDLVFADPASLLDSQAELAIYQQHQNDPADQRYRQFLAKLATPLLQRLPSQPDVHSQPWQGLDFGSGPGPTLSLMLAEAGLQMAVYDPYFAADKSVLQQRYDVICCTEAIEHFYQPAQEWQLWLQMLKAGSWLGLMTKLRPQTADFARWHYKNDPTHVSFFSQQTFQYLATRDGFSLEIIGNDVILLQYLPSNIRAAGSQHD